MCTIICRGTHEAELWPQQLGLPHPGHGPGPGWAGTGQGVPAHGMGLRVLPRTLWALWQWAHWQIQNVLAWAVEQTPRQRFTLQRPSGEGGTASPPGSSSRSWTCSARAVQTRSSGWYTMNRATGTAHTAQIRWFHTPSNRPSVKESLSCRTWWPKLHSPSPSCFSCPESRGAAELPAAPPNTAAELLLRQTATFNLFQAIWLAITFHILSSAENYWFKDLKKPKKIKNQFCARVLTISSDSETWKNLLL